MFTMGWMVTTVHGTAWSLESNDKESCDIASKWQPQETWFCYHVYTKQKTETPNRLMYSLLVVKAINYNV